MRLLSALFILVGALSYYLLEIDRSSTLALTLVELEGSLGGLSLWLLCFISGAGLGLGVRARPQKAAAPSRRPGGRIGRVMDYQAPASQASYDPHAQRANPWHQEIMTQARALRLEPGGRLQLERQGVPIGLLLERTTPEKDRRCIQSLAQLISTLPTPPRTRIEWQGCPAPASSRSKLVQGIFRERFPAPSFHATGNEDRVDLTFHHADPRWTTPYTPPSSEED